MPSPGRRYRAHSHAFETLLARNVAWQFDLPQREADLQAVEYSCLTRGVVARVGTDLVQGGISTVTTMQDLHAAAGAAEAWIDDLVRLLGWHDRARVYPALIATLHAFRDCLPRDEAIHVGTQLPALLRGFYYEGWHPGPRPSGKSREAFLERIRDGVHHDPAVDAEDVARAVFALLAMRISAAEVESAKAATPQPLHNLWPG